MARNVGAVCRQCRREGTKLFLKGTKCNTKCVFEKKGYAPGQHGRTRRFKQSEYAVQLREKQKVKRTYGLLEAQFHNYFEKAERKKGITGEVLLKMLECRLDNIVYRHFLVNGNLVDIPSYQVRAGDEVQVREKSRQLESIHSAMKRVREGKMLPWLTLDKAAMKGVLLEIPTRENIPVNVNEKLVVELYSK